MPHQNFQLPTGGFLSKSGRSYPTWWYLCVRWNVKLIYYRDWVRREWYDNFEWGGGGGGGGGGDPFFRSLENLFSFDPYILAKMRKMSYFDPYILAKLRKMSYFDPSFSSKFGKMYSFDTHTPPPPFFFTLVAFRVDRRWGASLSETFSFWASLCVIYVMSYDESLMFSNV